MVTVLSHDLSCRNIEFQAGLSFRYHYGYLKPETWNSNSSFISNKLFLWYLFCIIAFLKMTFRNLKEKNIARNCLWYWALVSWQLVVPNVSRKFPLFLIIGIYNLMFLKLKIKKHLDKVFWEKSKLKTFSVKWSWSCV